MLAALGIARGESDADACVKDLKELKKLETLNLSSTKITATAGADLQKALPRVKILP